MKLSLQQLAAAAGGRVRQGAPDLLLTGVSIDTRTLKPGDVFFALKGPRFDAHDFLARAVNAGAAALVIHRQPADWQAPASLPIIEVPETLAALQKTAGVWRHKMPAVLVGITGSNGKTTTKEMLAAILSGCGKTLATSGNLNNHIGLPLTLLRLEADDRYGVIEMGTSMPGDMDVLASLTHPHVALITNVGQDHLEYFGTPEGVLKENWKLVDALAKDGLTVLNLDDALLANQEFKSPGRVLRYSSHKTADVYATDIKPWPWPIQFSLVIEGKAFPAQLPVIGPVQVLNAVAAAAVAHGLGIPAEKIMAGLAHFKPAAMRMQITKHKSGAVLVNDAYNANPSSMMEAVQSFAVSFPQDSRWVVLGDMRELGPIAREAHVALGEWLVKQPLDRVYLYGRDTRFIEAGLLKHAPKMHVERFQKKRYLLQTLKDNLNSFKPAILFKASRRMRLETLVQELTT